MALAAPLGRSRLGEDLEFPSKGSCAGLRTKAGAAPLALLHGLLWAGRGRPRDPEAPGFQEPCCC